MLDAAECRRQPVVVGHSVDHRQRTRAFGQYYLELGGPTAGEVEVGGLPPDYELPVRRNSDRLGKDTAVCADSRLIGAEVGIEGEERIQERTVGRRIGIHRHALI